jgi:hypothetical protein
MEENAMDFITDNYLLILAGVAVLIIGVRLARRYTPLEKLKRKVGAIRVYPSGEYLEGLEKTATGAAAICIHARHTMVWASEKGHDVFGTLKKSDIKSCELQDTLTMVVNYGDGDQAQKAVFKFPSEEDARFARERIYAAYTNISISGKLSPRRTDGPYVPAEERLTELQDLRDKDMITEAEFQEKRKIILEEI